MINQTTQKSTVTNQTGYFQIEVKLNDTLLFSVVQYKIKSLVIAPEIYIQEEILVKLEEKVNELPDVVVRPFNLSGNLTSDVKNINTDNIVNASTLGLPNADVPIPTQSERKLYTATDWNFEYNKVKLDPLINAISGRTKMLKNKIKLEKEEDLVEKIIKDFGEDFFVIGLQIPENKIYEFLYFSASHERFTTVAKSGSAFDITNFLKAMSGQFLKQLNEKE